MREGETYEEECNRARPPEMQPHGVVHVLIEHVHHRLQSIHFLKFAVTSLAEQCERSIYAYLVVVRPLQGS